MGKGSPSAQIPGGRAAVTFTNALRTTRSTYFLTVSDEALGVPWVPEYSGVWEWVSASGLV